MSGLRSWLVDGLICAGGAGFLAVLLIGGALPVRAAVEPGLYFEPDEAPVGARVSVVDVDSGVGICRDLAFFLANAAVDVSGPDDPGLVRVDGVYRAPGDVDAAAFILTVPSLPPGEYRGYEQCPEDGLFGPTMNTLSIVARVPQTSVVPPAPGPDAIPRALLVAALGVLALPVTWRRTRPSPGRAVGRARRRDVGAPGARPFG